MQLTLLMARLAARNTVLLPAITSTHRGVKHTAEGTAKNVFTVICSTSIILPSIK